MAARESRDAGYRLELRPTGWVVADDTLPLGETPATAVEIYFWQRLQEAQAQKVTGATWLGLFAMLVILLVVCGTALGVTYLAGGC
jgi:hypothetical protein